MYLAGVVLVARPSQDYYILTNVIFESKNNVYSIEPKGKDDFNPNHEYRILWCTCTQKPELCQSPDSCQIFEEDMLWFKGKIFALGGRYSFNRENNKLFFIL